MTDEATSTTDSRLEDIPWRRTANVAGMVLLVAVVIPFVVFSVPQVVGADHSYVVLSGSMEPAMSPGDAIIVNSVPASQIDRNDVITFGGQAGDTPTTHRVIEVVERDGTTSFRTKGDANEDPDAALVTPDEVQGKVMSVGGYLVVIPLIGYVINFASTQLGFALLFGLPVFLFVLNEIWSIVASARSDATDGNTTVDSETTETSGVDDATRTADADAGNTDSTTRDEAGAVDPTAQSGTTEASTEANAEISFTAAELQLGLAINAVFLIYSAWVAYSIWTTYDTVETWALGVVGGVCASFLLLGGLYILGGGGGTTDTKAPTGPAPAPESDPDHSSSMSSDEATTDDDVTFPQATDPDIEITAFEPAEISDDTVAQRTVGDGEPVPSEGSEDDQTAGVSAGGETDE